jgi:hypothetical protein
VATLWADVNDVLDRWVGEDRPTDVNLVAQWVADAEQLILFEYPDLADRVTAGDVPVERVRIVVARMVSRVLRNPSGATAHQQAVGPFSTSVSFPEARRVDMHLTSDDRDLLGYAASVGRRPRAFTIDPTPVAAPELPDPWTPDQW